MPVLEGAATTSTRTSAVQLAERTRFELQRLQQQLAEEMTAASGALDFEAAARLRDELARVQAELDRRGV